MLVWRLVIGDMRRRRVQSLLLVVMIVTTTATLALGLALHQVSQSPFARTRAATKGPDLVAQNGPAPGSSRPSPSQFAPLIHAPAVAATAGPFPVAFTRLTAPGINVPVDAEGRDHTPAAVDQPLLTAGHWVSSGGAVIEQGLADSTRRPRRRHDFAGRPQVPRRGDRTDHGAGVLPGVLARPGVAHALRRGGARHNQRAARVHARYQALSGRPPARPRRAD